MSNELYYQARTAMDAGRLEEAIHAFQQSAQEEPHFKTYELLGECLVRLERFSEAVVYLAAATALNRGVRAPSLLAQAFLKLGMHSDSKDAAEIALSRDPTNRLAKMILQTITSEKT
jgi:tetratricopeptide (TPR) repeat protein